ncbi:hypothetical protein AVEN_56315-1 [Araneus ventricosus]|uniref:Uncharacterized protein n=1 Tax=Araneus ventricosus TaxID=182803 RepID=A0A4Y2WQM1_ARAVE|nr:hypothetical protein AVEN_56315-1 [Araneus ventricosus]
MSAEGDASRIVVPLMPSLSHIAAVRVAVPLYLGFSIETLKKACAEIEQGNGTVPGQDNENDLHVKYNRAKKHLLFIPGHLRKSVLDAVKGLREEFLSCLFDHPYIGPDKCYFHLRSDGTIDRSKIAREVVVDESIDIRKRFHVACVYNLRRSMWTLWDEMKASGRRENIESARTFFRFRMHDGFPVLYLQFPVIRDNPTIWLPRISTYLPGLEPRDRQRFLSYLRFSTDDDFLFCLYSATEEELEQILKIYAKRALFLHLQWPRQCLFLETADKMWNFIDVDCFHSLLKCMLIQKATENDYDYGKLFESFWNRSPRHLKKAAKDDPCLRRKINSYFNGKSGKRKTDEDERTTSKKKQRLLQTEMEEKVASGKNKD